MGLIDSEFLLGLWGAALSSLLAIRDYMQRRPKIDWYVREAVNGLELVISIVNPGPTTIQVREVRTVGSEDRISDKLNHWRDCEGNLERHIAHIIGYSYQPQIPPGATRNVSLSLSCKQKFPSVIRVRISFWQSTISPWRSLPKHIYITNNRLSAAMYDPLKL